MKWGPCSGFRLKGNMVMEKQKNNSKQTFIKKERPREKLLKQMALHS